MSFDFFIQKLVLLSLFLLVSGTMWAQSGIYVVTGEKVNVRSGPGTSYKVVGSKKKGDTVKVISLFDASWARIESGSSFAYVSRKYIAYKGPLPDREAQSAPQLKGNKKAHKGVWDILYEIVKVILWICVIIVVARNIIGVELGSIAALLLMITCIGVVVGWLVFGNGKAGAVIGMGVGILLMLRFLASVFDWDGIGMGWIGYSMWYIISFPFYLLDLLQFWLAKPWRPFLKCSSLSDNAKPGMRTFLRILQIPFYFALFPLRILNAVYYNIVIHNIYEFSNYVLEVVAPSDEEEGGEGFWKWLALLPYRFFKYVVGHGILTLLESVIWTVIDTFVPAVTLYHGTAESCADSMLCDPKRNKSRRRFSGWLSGIWNVGGGNYAGDGIYFGIFRKTLRNYQNGSAIVARVTMGKTIDVALMPNYVVRQAGHPNASAVSDWGLDHGYVSGEWWRSDRNTKWWEICLYDRQNRYNDSWRIRPIYAINSDTGVMQRVPGGTAHWFFREIVLKDFWNSIKQFRFRISR